MRLVAWDSGRPLRSPFSGASKLAHMPACPTLLAQFRWATSSYPGSPRTALPWWVGSRAGTCPAPSLAACSEIPACSSASHIPCTVCAVPPLAAGQLVAATDSPSILDGPSGPTPWSLVRSTQVLRGMNMAKSVLYWTLVVGFPCAGWLVLFPTLIYLKWSRRDLQGAASGGIIGG